MVRGCKYTKYEMQLTKYVHNDDANGAEITKHKPNYNFVRYNKLEVVLFKIIFQFIILMIIHSGVIQL